MASRTDNETINQHFISGVEQRLNASNPAASPQKQRIFEFEIADRDARILRLRNERGRTIGSNLSIFDLFSFDVGPDPRIRANFEDLFQKYERSIPGLTAAVLESTAISQKVPEQQVYELFVAKMLNFLRNPYSVAKVLNTFEALTAVHPTNPKVIRAYHRILTGQKPQQKHLCKTLGITNDEYGAWLRILFLLLEELMDGSPNLLEYTLQQLFYSKNSHTAVNIYQFDTERCLLSDRGVSNPIPAEHGLVLDFNLRDNAFIRYCFFEYNGSLVRPPAHVLESVRLGPKMIFLQHERNNLEMLRVFHHRIVDQAHGHVFCAGKTPFGVTLI
jgi:hypothetical protein